MSVQMPIKNIVISLCDYTGIFTAPWVNAGYQVIHVDPQRENNGTILEMMPVISKAVRSGRVAFVAGFPPCTELAVSGARHFEAKRLKDRHFQAKAALVAEQCRMIGLMSGAPWFFENPVSVLSSIMGKPDFVFSPNEYGGYLPEDDIHPQYPEFIVPRDAYPKTTCLWTGGGFVMPPKKEVEAVEDFPGWKKLGGKSVRTKNIRSATPRGFSVAVFEMYGLLGVAS